VWQNYDFYVRIPIEQSFNKVFLFLGYYEIVQKTMEESSIPLQWGSWKRPNDLKSWLMP